MDLQLFCDLQQGVCNFGVPVTVTLQNQQALSHSPKSS